MPPLSSSATRNGALMNSRASVIPAAPPPTMHTSVSMIVPDGTPRASMIIHIPSLTIPARGPARRQPISRATGDFQPKPAPGSAEFAPLPRSGGGQGGGLLIRGPQTSCTAGAFPCRYAAFRRRRNIILMPDVIVIEAGLQERNYWRDLWRYRELFYVLAWRDLSVRYKQTVIGAAWAVIRPVLTMVVFTVIFGRIAKLPSDGSAPYPLMVFAGMLPWTFFSTSLSEASGSLIGNANLISKVYFPRLIVPTATVVVAFADF